MKKTTTFLCLQKVPKTTLENLMGAMNFHDIRRRGCLKKREVRLLVPVDIRSPVLSQARGFYQRSCRAEIPTAGGVSGDVAGRERQTFDFRGLRGTAPPPP